MTDNEKLVEYGAVSTPWSYTQANDNMMGGSVKPRSWLFKGGKMMPYEFGFNEWSRAPVYKDLPDKPGFYVEFNSLLEQEGLNDLLRLTLLTDRKKAGIVRVEKTFDRSNVVFPMPANWAQKIEKEIVPAQWEFAPAADDILVPVKKLVCSFGCVCSPPAPGKL